VVDDETNDDSHKTDPTPAKPVAALPSKRKPSKVLKDDSDFEVSEQEDDKKDEEAVDDSSEQDDFVERTQNAKKGKQKKARKVSIANKYKGIEFKELTKELFKVTCVLHAKHKVKTSDTARI